MDFYFDNNVHIMTKATPYVKPLNEISIPNKNTDAGLWISDGNAEICKWNKDSNVEYLDTVPSTIKVGKENEKIISGRVVVNPGMLILQRSTLLKVETKTGRVLRPWIAKESKEGA
jgi:hypothetical protein